MPHKLSLVCQSRQPERGSHTGDSDSNIRTLALSLGHPQLFNVACRKMGCEKYHGDTNDVVKKDVVQNRPLH